MAQFVNVAAADQSPVYIDATQLTAIIRQGEANYCFTPEGHFAIQQSDLAVLAATLKQAGHELLVLQGLTPNDNPETLLVAANAIAFASVSQVSKDGNVGVIFGIKGMGHRDLSMPESAWYAILSVLQNSDRPLFSYTHEQAYARWTRPQELHIYPDSITCIRGDGRGKQLNVDFAGAGMLDIQVATVEKTQEMLQERYEQWRKQNPTLDLNDNTVFGPVVRQLEADVQKELSSRRTVLAHQLALSCGKLITVQNGTDDLYGPVYMKAEDITTISFGETRRPDEHYMYISRAKNQNSLTQPVSVYFNDSAKRDAAFDNIQQQLAARAQATARRTNTPKR